MKKIAGQMGEVFSSLKKVGEGKGSCGRSSAELFREYDL